MGYRSEVAITMVNNDFNTFVEQAKENNTEVFNLIKDAEIYQTRKYTTVRWSSIKWYDGYNEIDFITNYLKGIQHHFVRLGEDDDDNEFSDTYGDDNADMYECAMISRSIDIIGTELNLE